MAEAKVVVTLKPSEYRLWRNETELHVQELHNQAKGVKGKAQADLRKREMGLKFILEKV